MILDKDFEDFISSLNNFNVGYMVVGGYIGFDDLIKNKEINGRPRTSVTLKNLKS